MNKYEQMSVERKEGIVRGDIPEWFTGGGYQLFKEKYQWAPTPRQQYEAIASTAAKHLKGTVFEKEAYDRFFNLLWSGWLSPSTPILANMGTNRGLPVSCSGGYIPDSIDGFYSSRRETAILTKYGFGTSGYLGDIRGRGSNISIGGRASGVLPVFRGFVRDMQEVAQGTQRRGAWAGYLPISHPDFDELVDLLHHKPDDLNVGWVVTESFISLLQEGDEDAVRRYQKALKVKMITGKGYFFFVDKANRHRPSSYIGNDLDIKASNLCTEIMLHSSEDYTFTCVLSSMNLAKWDEWKDTDAVYWATIFLDCVASEFIEKAVDIPGLEKAVDFTEKGRALGLGVCGFHTLLQMKGIPFESLDAQFLNTKIFSDMSVETFTASYDMGEELGIPEWCQGFSKRRNTHTMAIAPTKSTALIMGGVSEGINPDPAMTYTQITAAGEVERINPVLLDLMKRKGIYTEDKIQEVVDAFGSVQEVEWLTDEEKLVFKTAFEINQEVVLRLASQRQQYIDQGQSLNLFFSEETPEEEISRIHKLAFEDENILSLYYCYSKAGVPASKGDCQACM